MAEVKDSGKTENLPDKAKNIAKAVRRKDTMLKNAAEKMFGSNYSN